MERFIAGEEADELGEMGAAFRSSGHRACPGQGCVSHRTVRLERRSEGDGEVSGFTSEPCKRGCDAAPSLLYGVTRGLAVCHKHASRPDLVPDGRYLLVTRIES